MYNLCLVKLRFIRVMCKFLFSAVPLSVNKDEYISILIMIIYCVFVVCVIFLVPDEAILFIIIFMHMPIFFCIHVRVI